MKRATVNMMSGILIAIGILMLIAGGVLSLLVTAGIIVLESSS